LLIVAVTMRASEARHLTASVGAIALVPLVPALWMLVQVLPLGFARLSHSVWPSAAEALGRPLRGAISVDPGATVVALIRYQAAVALALVAAAVAVDRSRAGWMLTALTAAAAVIAVMVIIHGLGIVSLFPEDAAIGDAASSCVVLAVILAATALIRAHERQIARKPPSGPSLIAAARSYALPAVALLAGLIALPLAATTVDSIALAFGLATLIGAVAVRRFDLGPWGCSAIVATAVLVAATLVALQAGSRKVDLTLAFAAARPASSVPVAERILADAPRTGTGAGTFFALVPIYRSSSDLDVAAVAPTAAAAVAVEMGRPMLWAGVIAAFGLAAFLLQAAARRGRDYFYSATGAGCLVAAIFMSFSGIGLFSTATTAVLAVVVGLAFGQSKSRTLP
jgi:hypothetical protein